MYTRLKLVKGKGCLDHFSRMLKRSCLNSRKINGHLAYHGMKRKNFIRTFKINKVLKVKVQRTALLSMFVMYPLLLFHKKQNKNPIFTED